MTVVLDREAYEKSFEDLVHEFNRDALRVIVARAEGTEFSSIGAGSTVEVGLTWDRGDDIVAADIERVVIERTVGDCTSIDVEIRAKTSGTGIDIAYAFPTGDVPIFDESPSPRPVFLSEDTGADRHKIFLAIKPNGGAVANSFKARIYARPRR